MKVRHLSMLAAAALLAAGSAAQSWVQFTDATATRMSLLGTTATTDVEEKDFWLVDIDHDGDQDLINVRKEAFYLTGNRTHLLLMNLNGVLTDMTATYAPGFNSNPSLGRSIIAADFDGDGWEDVVIANTDFQPAHYYRNLGSVGGVWQGLGFENARIPVFTPGGRFCSMAHGDVDNDGDLDLFLGDYNNTLEDRLLINDGTGHFTDATNTRIPNGSASTFSVEAAIVDMNLDGWNDIVESDGTVGQMKIRLNDGTGNFPTLFFTQTAATYTMQVGDINNDGKLDIYQGRDGQDAYLINTTPAGSTALSFTETLLNNTPGAPGYSPGTTNFAGNAYLIDIDKDGDNDLVMADTDVDVAGCDRHATLLENTPSAPVAFTDPYGTNLQNFHTFGTHDIAVLDLNGDTWPDMIYGLCTGYKVFMQIPRFQLVLNEPQPGGLNLQVMGAQPNSSLYNLISLVQRSPVGSGPFFGLDSSAFLNLVNAPGMQPMWATTNAQGAYGFTLPAGTIGFTLPMQARSVQVLLNGSIAQSNIATYTF